MIENDTILLYWKKAQKETEKNLGLLQQRIQTDAIHDIRVAIKKLRAFLHLYGIMKKEPGCENLLEKTIALFDILGRYRDIEICLALTNEFEKEKGHRCKELKTYLQSLLKITRAWSNEAIHRYHKKEFAKAALLLKQAPYTINNRFMDDLTRIINEQLAETKKHLRQPHFVRKKLKEVYYWIGLFPDETAQGVWHQKELHSILDDLGNWQDKEILAVRVKHFRKDYLPKPFEEYPLLKDLENKTRDDKQVLLKSATSKVLRWMKKVLLANKELSER